MMKKRKWLLPFCVVVGILLFVPIPTGKYKDGGTREYTALTYKIVDWNRLNGDTIYDKTKVYFFPNNFKSIDSLWYMEENRFKESGFESEPSVAYKPVIYLYTEDEMEVSV